MSDRAIKKEDYEEPNCPLKRPGRITRIPVRRVIEKLDEYLNRNDYPAAEKHLLYWRSESEKGMDKSGRLTVLNEQIGLYRKLQKREEALEAIDQALDMLIALDMKGTITEGTTLINAATAYKSFDMGKEALPLYQGAREVYVQILDKQDPRLAGLYNNMALTLLGEGETDEAEKLLFAALSILETNELTQADQAITCCNLADLAAAKMGSLEAEEQINHYLDKALSLLNSEELPRDGYYAFVCEKCAPTFGYYGHFFTERELRKRAEEIYERN